MSLSSESSSPLQGLSESEVLSSRLTHGTNLITPAPVTPWWVLYFRKFSDPIIRILLIASIIALSVGIFSGHYSEGVGILIAIFLSTSLSFFNEYRASQEFSLLNRVSDDDLVAVIRSGQDILVSRKDLVVGDLVVLDSGSEIPADGIILSSISLRLDESSLTGESSAVLKVPLSSSSSSSPHLSYPSHCVYRGCTVLDGRGLMEVTAVGDSTEVGHTTRVIQSTSLSPSPLEKQLHKLAKLIGVFGFFSALIVFVTLTLRGIFENHIYDIFYINGLAVSKSLSFGQWYFFSLLFIFLGLLLSIIWLPILGDAFYFLNFSNRFSSFFYNLSKFHYRHIFLLSFFILFSGFFLGLFFNLFSLDWHHWVPLPALKEFLRYFMISITIIVVAVPEGLPMSVTLSLAYSMRKMTASHNLVRNIQSCETIGAVTTICSDKTGTLTMNKMSVFSVDFPSLPRSILTDDFNSHLISESISINSTARLSHDTLNPQIGNPTECALLSWVNSFGLDYKSYRSNFQIFNQVPFNTELKYMITHGRSTFFDRSYFYIKGAPELILSFCNQLRSESGVIAYTDLDKSSTLSKIVSLQNRGMRVLAFAYVPLDIIESSCDLSTFCHDLIWLGFISISDPIRPDIPSSLALCHKAGINVKIVTGDNQLTAQEIARQIGLWDDSTDTSSCILTGSDFSKLASDESFLAAKQLKIISRARPIDKLNLVKTLQSSGEVVAVTGDGTNDAAALHQADVGLAMGITGTSVAKSAADIILLDDSFTSILNAVAWGRSLYRNIQKFIQFQLSINLAALGIALLGPFLGIYLPLTVSQMLWVNLIMDTFAALALASEPADMSLLNGPPRSPDSFIITSSMRNNIFFISGLLIFLFLVVVLFLPSYFPLDESTPQGLYNLTIFFTSFVFIQLWNLFNARTLGSNHSAFYNLSKSKVFLLMVFVIFIGQILLVELGGDMFRTVSLRVSDWFSIFFFSSFVLIIGEFYRYFRRLFS